MNSSKKLKKKKIKEKKFNNFFFCILTERQHCVIKPIDLKNHVADQHKVIRKAEKYLKIKTCLRREIEMLDKK
jgi:hypothetical protein